jgi:hypothetical protein
MVLFLSDLDDELGGMWLVGQMIYWKIFSMIWSKSAQSIDVYIHQLRLINDLTN